VEAAFLVWPIIASAMYLIVGFPTAPGAAAGGDKWIPFSALNDRHHQCREIIGEDGRGGAEAAARPRRAAKHGVKFTMPEFSLTTAAHGLGLSDPASACSPACQSRDQTARIIIVAGAGSDAGLVARLHRNRVTFRPQGARHPRSVLAGRPHRVQRGVVPRRPRCRAAGIDAFAPAVTTAAGVWLVVEVVLATVESSTTRCVGAVLGAHVFVNVIRLPARC
jgi:hypothetical protein